MDPVSAAVSPVITVVKLVLMINDAISKAKHCKSSLARLWENIYWALPFCEQIGDSLKPDEFEPVRKLGVLFGEILTYVTNLEGKFWWKHFRACRTIGEFETRIFQCKQDIMLVTSRRQSREYSRILEEVQTIKDDNSILKDTIADLTAAIRTMNLEKESAEKVMDGEGVSFEEVLKEATEELNGSLKKQTTILSQRGSAAGDSTTLMQGAPLLNLDDFSPSLHHLSASANRARKLGRGAFGNVYKVDFRGKTVAVKILHIEKLSVDSEREIRKEFALMKSLGEHPNVLSAHGLVIDDDLFALVIAHASDGSLRSIITKENTPRAQPDRLQWARDIAAGMAFLHRGNPPIVHRDLKSENVLIHEGRAQVSDFGCALAREETTRTLTLKHVAGTLHWMPPEAFSEKKIQGKKGDVYAFALLLWELGSWKSPWQNCDPNIIPTLVKDGKRPSMKEMVMPQWYVNLIEICWTQNPVNRPRFDEILTMILQKRSASLGKWKEFLAKPPYCDHTARTVLHLDAEESEEDDTDGDMDVNEDYFQAARDGSFDSRSERLALLARCILLMMQPTRIIRSRVRNNVKADWLLPPLGNYRISDAVDIDPVKAMDLFKRSTLSFGNDALRLEAIVMVAFGLAGRHRIASLEGLPKVISIDLLKVLLLSIFAYAWAELSSLVETPVGEHVVESSLLMMITTSTDDLIKDFYREEEFDQWQPMLKCVIKLFSGDRLSQRRKDLFEKHYLKLIRIVRTILDNREAWVQGLANHTKKMRAGEERRSNRKKNIHDEDNAVDEEAVTREVGDGSSSIGKKKKVQQEEDDNDDI